MTIDERNKLILTLYEQGVMLKDIAARVGVSPNHTGQLLKKMGVARPTKTQKKKRTVDDAAIIAAYRGGLAISAVAERFGVGDACVKHVLRTNGVKMIGRHRYDGEGGMINFNGGAFARIARRT